MNADQLLDGSGKNDLRQRSATGATHETLDERAIHLKTLENALTSTISFLFTRAIARCPLAPIRPPVAIAVLVKRKVTNGNHP